MTSPAGNRSEPGKSGRLSPSFTLVELMVVAAIMGLLAGVAAMSLRGLRSPALNAAADEAASALKNARQMAIGSGRRTFVLFPITTNALLASNTFRSYAIFEEIPAGEEFSQPDSSGNTVTNTATNAVYIPKTEWRTLPEGTLISHLAGGFYSVEMGDPFPRTEFLGQPRPRRAAQTSGAGQEWQFFESFKTFDVRNPGSPGTSLATLTNVPFLAFYPNGRAYYLNAGYGSGTALCVVQGYVSGSQVVVTDTNKFFNVETDPVVGRVRVRSRQSYVNF